MGQDKKPHNSEEVGFIVKAILETLASEQSQLHLHTVRGTRESASEGMEEWMRVWDLIPPERDALVRLRSMAFRNRILYKVLTWVQRRYVDALMLARWDRIRSPLVLKILAPIVKKLLKALGWKFRESRRSNQPSCSGMGQQTRTYVA